MLKFQTLCVMSGIQMLLSGLQTPYMCENQIHKSLDLRQARILDKYGFHQTTTDFRQVQISDKFSFHTSRFQTFAVHQHQLTWFKCVQSSMKKGNMEKW